MVLAEETMNLFKRKNKDLLAQIPKIFLPYSISSVLYTRKRRSDTWEELRSDYDISK